MKDDKLTAIMFKSLNKDPKLATVDEWRKAGDWAVEMRFFPHALSCYQLAAELNKDENILMKISDVIDRITNVLEFVPPMLKAPLEEIRLSNPLDPSKWLAISNSLLKETTAKLSAGKAIEPDLVISSTFALSFGAYCACRSGNEIQPINELLKDLIAPADMRGWTSPKLNLKELARSKEIVKIVALGDNVTLGLQSNWEIRFHDTYHYLWLHDLKLNTSLANNAISGAGVLDLALYLGRDAIYYKPDIVLINYGLNDAWLGKEILLSYESLLESCIRILQGHKIQVVLISPIPQIPSACPIDQRPTDIDLKEAEMEAYAQACKRIAVRTGCVFADAYSKFPSSEHERKQYLVNGFNMPNLAGQKLIKSALDDITN